jgi:hypothetical protein
VVNSGNPFSSNKDTTLSILKGNGNGSFQPAATQVLWGGFNGSGGDAIAVGDFGTGQLDLAVANFSQNQIMILHGQGDGTFTPAGTYLVGAGPEGIAALDFNGDGKVKGRAMSSVLLPTGTKVPSSCRILLGDVTDDGVVSNTDFAAVAGRRRIPEAVAQFLGSKISTKAAQRK